MKTPCTACEGSGKMTIHLTHLFSDEPIEITEIDCVVCDGSGLIGERERRMLEFERTMWCECPDRNELDWVYHRDNERGATLRKHHYTCPRCKKVTQIG